MLFWIRCNDLSVPKDQRGSGGKQPPAATGTLDCSSLTGKGDPARAGQSMGKLAISYFARGEMWPKRRKRGVFRKHPLGESVSSGRYHGGRGGRGQRGGSHWGSESLFSGGGVCPGGNADEEKKSRPPNVKRTSPCKSRG